jgi:MoxR-like ATPase
MQLYDRLNVKFLLDPPKDAEEEEAEEAEGEEQTDANAAATSAKATGVRGAAATGEGISLLRSSQEAFATQVPSTQQVRLLAGFEDMVAGLREHLRPFAESGKEVSKEDIDKFFSDLKRRRK